jgi:hypothetical protein
VNPNEHRDDPNGWIDVDFHISDTYRALDEAFAELWSDPAMADYDGYEDITGKTFSQ